MVLGKKMLNRFAKKLVKVKLFSKATKLYSHLITRNLFFYIEIFGHYRPGVRYIRVFYIR